MGRKATKFKVSTTVRGILIENEEVQSMVEGRIFPCVAPEDTVGDFIIYFRDEYSIDDTKMGIYSQTATVMLAIVSNDYDRSQDLAEIVFHALHGAFKTDTGDMVIKLKDSTEDFIEKKFFQFLLFEIQ